MRNESRPIRICASVTSRGPPLEAKQDLVPILSLTEGMGPAAASHWMPSWRNTLCTELRLEWRKIWVEV